MPLGPWEIFIILVILVVIFGAGRLSQVGGAMGKSVREFRGAAREEPAPAPAPPPPPVVTAPPVECPECRAVNPATNRFCSACGATMVVAQAAMPAVAAEAPTAHDAALAPNAHEATLAPPGEPVEEDALTQHAPVSVPANTCPSCATVNPPGQPFCGQCGTRLKNAAA
jgi:sec-independent protein translocase protein TatA